MRELTKQQKLKVLDRMIEIQKTDTDGLCFVYDKACKLLGYTIKVARWTSRFKELDNAIDTEITRTGGIAFINYKNWKKDRIALIKRIRKEL